MSLSVCDSVTPIDNRIAVLILQHPQEQDKLLGTGRLTGVQFRNATFRIGLSWPSLAKALGTAADPKRWAILYLGSADGTTFPKGRTVVALDRDGDVLRDQDAALAGIEGIVAFDGTWSQAKTLWWRNPWVLKARRIALNPKEPSLYGKLRREPRRDGLSTLEAVALTLAELEGRPEIGTTSLSTFRRMLQRYRSALETTAAEDSANAAAT